MIRLYLCLFLGTEWVSLITINGKEISIAIVVGFFDVDLIKFILLFFFSLQRKGDKQI